MEETFILIAYTFLISLVFSFIGFIRTVWFISIGYTASIVACCVAVALFYTEHIQLYNWLQIVLLGLWGARLGFFIVVRELNRNYRQAVKEQTDASQSQSFMIKIVIWLSVCLLYALMFSPIIFALQKPFTSLYPLVAYFGVGLMALGLILESLADHQKSKFKQQHPKEYCNVGLYRWVRCPNYFGEILVWTGNLVVALVFMQIWWQWILAIVGWVCILLIMMGSTKRLEKSQNERYGKNSAFKKYISTVPVLFPWLPIYSLQNVRVYIE